ncbi:RING-type E3 ubiquitin transferase [Malassezia cuniculi]|uniref:RING-type E3 ubiquitin transferase n=1 Tax=Malassezia cuniculi TaxID=948313 RepID=A0AAF0EV10_9BASI|nr:RING-type E3 ubiquitin transferase [Malassezia cuniculi]
MKFGKEYERSLANPLFPNELRQSAIEYKKVRKNTTDQLKHLLHEVVDELDSLGLSADVLDDMLVPPAEDQHAPKGPRISVLDADTETDTRPAPATPLAIFSQDDSAVVHWIDKIPHRSRRATTPTNSPPLKLKSKSPSTFILKPRGKMHLNDSPLKELDQLADEDKGMGLVTLPPLLIPEHESPKRTSHRTALRTDWQHSRKLFPDSPTWKADESLVRSEGNWVEGSNGRRVLAEYHVLNDGNGIQSQLMFYVQSPDSNNSPAESLASPLSLEKSDSSPDIAPMEMPSAAKKIERMDKTHPAPPGYYTRRVIVPLAADKRFFSALSSAVNNLVQAQYIQQAALVEHVRQLGNTISQLASPEFSPVDMYLWRQVFSLWLEHEIFESTREVDRGEISVAETEKRIYHFVRELQKRGFVVLHSTIPSAELGTLDKWTVEARGAASPFRDVNSFASLEHFLRLNVALLALKRFQRASIEAVRKILKKHEKRTALHAQMSVASFFPNQEIVAALVQRTEGGSYEQAISMLAEQIRPSSRVHFLSLPRILASMLTERLLPVLPSVEDHSCPICMTIAWHPIRLDCKHLFCIRCLVKLQKQGTNDCPVCRAPGVVESADKRNLDNEQMAYMLKWFPNEVDEKTIANREERELEERDEKAGIVNTTAATVQDVVASV